jgi:hypothetical protein
MAKLRTLLAAALLTVPVLTMSMNVAADDAQTGPRIEATTAATGCCWAYFMGRWICMPC